MSRTPRTQKDPSPLRVAFARAYVRLGGMNATKAALVAGYSANGKGASAAVIASRLLRDPQVLALIKEETERTLRAGVALGASVLEQLAREGRSESVRLAAAQALLDRGGMQLAALSEHHVVVEDRRTDAELLSRIEELSRDLGLSARVIPGEVVETPRPALSAKAKNGGSGCNSGYTEIQVDDSS